MGRATAGALFKKDCFSQGNDTCDFTKHLPHLILPVLEHYLMNAKGMLVAV